jgi:hypothetical protein
VLFVGDVLGIVWLGWRAYGDGKCEEWWVMWKGFADEILAATLDRYEVPFFGGLASGILDDEWRDRNVWDNVGYSMVFREYMCIPTAFKTWLFIC